MKTLIIGFFPEEVREKIRSCFPVGWDLRIAAPEEAARELAEAEILIPEHLSVDEALLDRAPRLRFVQTGAGFDNVDLAACARRGITVCGAPGINAGAVAEHVMAFLLCWYKNLLYLDGSLKAHRAVPELCYTGAELAGKTIGIVGLGHVGRRLAALCHAFGMRVLGCSRIAEGVPGVEPCGMDVLLRKSDIVSLHVPLSEETRGLIDAAALEKMKPDALLVNSSRGAVVDEAALIRALREGAIAGACLDVYAEEPLPVDSPLRELPNVILTPHTAGFPDGVGFHRRRYAFFAENICRFVAGEVPDGRM